MKEYLFAVAYLDNDGLHCARCGKLIDETDSVYRFGGYWCCGRCSNGRERTKLLCSTLVDRLRY